MSELASIFRQYGSAYRKVRDKPMVPSHRRAIQDITRCRTKTLGGHVYQCSDCHETEYRYHSCRNRHYPKCQSGAGQRWLAKQQNLLLPVPYFLVTFTLPASLRQAALSNQKELYKLRIFAYPPKKTISVVSSLEKYAFRNFLGYRFWSALLE